MKTNIEQISTRQRMLQEELTSSESQIKLVSDRVILSYIDKIRTVGNAQGLPRYCHYSHNSLVHHILVGLQDALNNYLMHMPYALRRVQVCIFFKRVFHITIVNMKGLLRNKLHYRIAMHTIILKIMENNRLRCMGSNAHIEKSSHTPIPLMMLILWRVKALEWEGLSVDNREQTGLGGLFHQMETLMDMMGMDKETLEEEYKMAVSFPLIPVSLRREGRRRMLDRPQGQRLIDQYFVIE
jgi:hypothetical protein